MAAVGAHISEEQLESEHQALIFLWNLAHSGNVTILAGIILHNSPNTKPEKVIRDVITYEETSKVARQGRVRSGQDDALEQKLRPRPHVYATTRKTRHTRSA